MSSYNKAGKLSLIGSFNQHVESISYNPFQHTIVAGNTRLIFNLDNHKLSENPFGSNIKSATYFSKNLAVISSSSSSQFRSLKLQTEYDDSVFSLLKENITFFYHANEKVFINVIRDKRSKQNLYDAKNKTLYISYSDGLYCYVKNKELQIKLNSKSILSSSIQISKKGGIWCATLSGEVYHLQKNIITEVLPINTQVSKIIEWNNYLFLVTKKGVLKYNLTTKEGNLIDKLDGLPSNQVLDIEIVNDYLFIATSKGVAKLLCSYKKYNNIAPTINIDKVSIWEKDTLLRESYNLTYEQNNFTFYFRAIATRSQQEYTFQYRLLGLDSNWIELPSKINFARYPSLPPGNFVFEVKTVNEDGIESDIPAQIKLFIDAPFYQKWWFYLGVVVFITLIISALFLLRIQIIRKRNKVELEKENVEKELSRSQLTSLRSQMNPHFMFNALNSIQEFIITNKREQAGNYLGDFADLMRIYLSHSQKEMVSVEDEVRAMELYLHLEKVRFENTLTCSVSVEKGIDKEMEEIPSMLIQPFVENALKHGLLHKKTDRNLEVKFLVDEQFLICTIKDNGVGRAKSAEINKMRGKIHESYATSAIEKRVDLLNEDRVNKIMIETIDLFDDNNQSTGTLVRVKVPK